jgi:hypothetical protein
VPPELASASPPPRKGLSLRGARGLRNLRRQSLLGRTGILGPAIGIAAILVVLITVAAYLNNSPGSGARGLAQALNMLPKSNSVAALEAERQNLIVMDAAAGTLSTGSKPTVVNPQQVIASASSPATSSSGNSGTTVNVAPAPPANPGTAEAIAQQLMPSFGFSVSGQYSCLYHLWMRESSWNVYAENPSGAYGIPQARPGDKMASAGSDWRTNPATQIKWGLGYIKGRYGTPCGAWAQEESAGYY